MKKTIKNAISSLTAKLAALLFAFTCAGSAWGADPVTIQNERGANISVYEVSSGFYQSGTTYNNSIDFYITNLNGLKFFRDIVNGETAASYAYFTATGVTGTYPTTPAGIKSFHSNNMFSGMTVHLLADLDLAGEQWITIGFNRAARTITDPDTSASAEVSKCTFYGLFDAGIYDGEGNLTGTHVISNLDTSWQYVPEAATLQAKYQLTGLFGQLSGGTTAGVKNLTVRNATVVGRDSVGVIAGRSYNGGAKIENCHVVGNVNVSGTGTYIGGLVGECRASIVDSSVDAAAGSSISGLAYVGGLAGSVFQYNANDSVEVSGSAVSNTAVNASYSGVAGVGALVGVTNPSGTYHGNVVISGNEANNVPVSAPNSSASKGGVGTLVGNALYDDGAYAILSDNTVSGTTSATAGGEAVTAKMGTANDNLAVGENVTFDANGEVIGGIFEVINEELIASGYLAVDNPDNTTSASYPLTVGGPYVATVSDANGTFKSGYATFAAALAAALDGETVTLISGPDTAISAAGEVTGGKTITVTGTAKFNWDAGWLMVGRGSNSGDGTLIFKDATITSSSTSTGAASTGINISGHEKGSSTKNNGTVIITNSYIECRYLIDKGTLKVIGNGTVGATPNLVVLGGFDVCGRPANETESGEDATAYMELSNGAYVQVKNINGLGVGREGNGVVSITGGSKFEHDYANGEFINLAKGTVSIDATSEFVGQKMGRAGTILVDATGAETEVKVFDLTDTSSLSGSVTVNNLSADAGVVYGSDGDVTIKPGSFVAMVGETKYENLADAIYAAYNGGTVTLLTDITVADWEQNVYSLQGASAGTAAGPNGLVIDGNGHSLTVSSLSQNSVNNGAYLLSKGNFTVKNLTVNLPAGATGFAPQGGSFENVTINGGKRAMNLQWTTDTVAIDGCTFSNPSSSVFYTEGGTKVAVNDSKFNSANLSVNGAWTFTSNTVTSSSFDIGALADGSTIEKNDFSGATVTLYSDGADLSGNYWGGSEVDPNTKIASQSGKNYTATLDNWYNTIAKDESGSIQTLDNLYDVPYVASLTTTDNKVTKYLTVDDALKAAKTAAGATVNIFAGSYTLTTTSYTFADGVTVIGETDSEGNNLVTINNKELQFVAKDFTLKNVNIVAPSGSALHYAKTTGLFEHVNITSPGNGIRECQIFPDGTMTFKDCNIHAGTYGIHYDTGTGSTINIIGGSISGWNSFGSVVKQVNIIGTEFPLGTSYNQLRFYQDAVISNATFNGSMNLDFGQNGESMILSDCVMADGSDVKDHISASDLANENRYVAVGNGVVLDEDGKIVGGVFEIIDDETIAPGYISIDNPDSATSANYPLTVGGPYKAVFVDADGKVKNGFGTLKEAFEAVNSSLDDTVNIRILSDIETSEWTSGADLIFSKNLTIDAYGTDPVTVNLQNLNPLVGSGKTMEIGEKVVISRTGQFGSYAGSSVVLNGDVGAYQWYLYQGTVTVNPCSTNTLGFGDGQVGMWGDVAINVQGAMEDAAHVDISTITPQVSGGYVKYFWGNQSISLKDTFVSTTWIVGDSRYSNYEFGLSLDNSILQLTGSGDKTFNFLGQSTGTISLKGSRIIANGGTVAINASDTVNMDWKSSITAKNFTNTGKIVLDMAGFDGTFPLTLVSTTDAAAQLGDFEVINNTSGATLMLDANGNIVAVEAVAQIGDKQYGTLEAAIAAAQTGDTVTLLADTSVADTMTINKSMTLDLNGKTITNTSTGKRPFYVVTEDPSAVVATEDEDGNVVFEGATTLTVEGNGGSLVIPDGGTAYGFFDIAGGYTGIIINGGTISGDGGNGSLIRYGVDTGYAQQIALNNVTGITKSRFVAYAATYYLWDISVVGGTYTHNNAGNYNGAYLKNAFQFLTQNGIFDGVTITSDEGSCVYCFGEYQENMVFRNNTFTVKGKSSISDPWNNATIAVSSEGSITIESGTYTSAGIYGVATANSGATINIEGGTITGADYGVRIYGGGYAPDTTLNISGTASVTGGQAGVYVLEIGDNNGTVTANISGGTIAGGITINNQTATPSRATVEIEDGEISGTLTDASPSGKSGVFSVSGGVFSSQVPAGYCAADYSPVANTDPETSEAYPYTVASDYEAQIVRNGAVVTPKGTLTAMIAAAQAGDTVQLLKDIELTDRLFVNAGATPAYEGSNNRYATTSENKSVTLDLNGFNITSESNIALAGGSLNITGTGTITTTGSGLAPIEIYGKGDLANKRTLTIGSGVTLNSTNSSYGLNVFGSNDAQKNLIDVTVNGTVNGTIFVLGNLKNAENEINIVVNGTVAAPAGEGDNVNVGIALNGNANVTVNNGAEVSGDSGIEVRAGTLTVNGGTITGTASEYSYKANGSGSTTKGAAIAVAQHGTALDTAVTLNGGTLNGVKTIGVTDVNGNMDNVEVLATQGYTAGSSIPDDYKWVAVENTNPVMYKLTAKDYVAQVFTGETAGQKYESLDEALKAASSGDTVKLLKDVSLTDRLFVNAGTTPTLDSKNRYATTSENKSVTLDLNGFNITSESNIALAGGSLNVTGTGKISTTNDGLAPIEVRGTGDLAAKRTLTIGEDVTLEGAEYGLNVFGSNDAQKNLIDVTVDGTVNGTLFVLGNLKNVENAINIVVNGTVAAPAGEGDKVNVGIALNGNANVTVNDGAEVSGDSGIEVRAGTLTVNGGTITGTASEYSYKANGSGSTTKGAAIAVAQHGTALDTVVTLNGGTLEGVKTIGVTDVNGNMDNVEVLAKQGFTENSAIPDDYKWVETETPGVYELVPKDYVAQIGDDGEKFEMLAEAFAAAQSGETVKLLKDIELTNRLFVNAGATPAYGGSNNRYATTSENKTLTLDMNDHDITGSSNIALAGGSLTITGTGKISTTTSGLAPIEVRGTGSLTSKRTLTIGTGVTLEGKCYGVNVFGSNNADKNVIDVNVNGTVKGMVFVLGNLTNSANEININVTGTVDASAATGEESVHTAIAQCGYSTVTVSDGAVVKGESGIETRAGTLTVNGGTITATEAYNYASNGSGTTTKGAAVAVAQYGADRVTSVTINGGTLSGEKKIAVTDVNNDMSKVKVFAKEADTTPTVIPAGYSWAKSTEKPGMWTLVKQLDSFTYPIEGTAGIPVDLQWLEDNLEDVTLPILETQTDDIIAALSEKGDNGIPVWQSYVLGLDPSDPDATLRLTAEPVANESTKVVVSAVINLANMPVIEGTTVSFRLAARNGDEWTTVESATPVTTLTSDGPNNNAPATAFIVSLDDVAGKVLAIFADIVTE